MLQERPRTHQEYRHAAETLWGTAGAYAADEFQRLNETLFSGELPPLPIVVGITAFGHCLGLTRDQAAPRITLASNIFDITEHGQLMKTAYPYGANVVTDVLTHEMVHAKLMLAGEDPSHNAPAWCEEITRLSPMVLGHEIAAAPVKPRRIKEDGKSRVVRRPLDGHLAQGVLARWPGSLRPAGWDRGKPIPVDTY